MKIDKHIDGLPILVEQIFHIDTMVSDDHVMDGLFEALEDNGEDIIELVGLKVDDWIDEITDSFGAAGMFITSEKKGFLVQIAQPVKDGDHHWGWGYYRTMWGYGDTLEEAHASAITRLCSKSQ